MVHDYDWSVTPPQHAGTVPITWRDYVATNRHAESKLLERVVRLRSNLSWHRQRELFSEISETNHRLLNFPWWLTQRDRFTLVTFPQ